jgi:endonuclease YncB( thermonuclease family)
LKSIFNISSFFISLAVFSIFLALPLFSFAGPFKVVHLYDGDTIEVTENGKELTVRLVGIDAPEISTKKHLPGQPFCLKAKEYLSALVLNKVVRIRFYGKDESGKSLGGDLCRKGQHSKKSVKGIWELRDQYFSPWDWRELHKN